MAVLISSPFSRMSRNLYYSSSMGSTTPYAYGSNYSSLYWPPQSDNVSSGYFDHYRMTTTNAPAGLPPPPHNYCKYADADSTQVDKSAKQHVKQFPLNSFWEIHSDSYNRIMTVNGFKLDKTHYERLIYHFVLVSRRHV